MKNKQKRQTKNLCLLLAIAMIITNILSINFWAVADSAETSQTQRISKYDIIAGADYFSEDVISSIINTRSAIIDSGDYYLNNNFSGKYLRYYNGNLSTQNGLLSSLSSTIKWTIVPTGDYYYIRSATDSTKYLIVPENTTSNSVEIATYSATPHPRAKWDISVAIGGGCLIKSNYNSKYLGSSLQTSSSIGSAGTDTYSSYVWRIAGTSYYGNTSSYEKRELKSGFTVNNMTVDEEELKSIVINKYPSNALWANLSDFSYAKLSIAGYNGNLSINASNGKLTGITAGLVNIKAVHKVTGLQYTFTVDVQPLLEKSADYDLSANIVKELKLIRTSISQIEASNMSSANKAMMIDELELQEDLIRADYILEGYRYNDEYANAVIENFASVIDNNISTVSDDLYRVVANRMLVLYAQECSSSEINALAYFLDVDCIYNEWTYESQQALNWYYASTTGSDFFNRSGSVAPSQRSSTKIQKLRIYKHHHDCVKDYSAVNIGGLTEVTVGYSNGGYGRADIVQDITNRSKFWEVKPNGAKYYGGGIGTTQLSRYICEANKTESVHKGGHNFPEPYSAGMPITPYYLMIKELDGSDTLLEVTPSPYYATVPYDSGLILYKEVNTQTQSYQTYYETDRIADFINNNAFVAMPVDAKATLNGLVYTITAFAVIGGITVGILVACPQALATGVSQVLTGTATNSTIATVHQAINAGTVTIGQLAPYAIEMVAGATV